MVRTTQTKAGPYVMVNTRSGAPVAARLDVVRAMGRRCSNCSPTFAQGRRRCRYLVARDAPGPRRRSVMAIASLDCDG